MHNNFIKVKLYNNNFVSVAVLNFLLFYLFIYLISFG